MLPKIVLHTFNSKRRFGVEMEINRHINRNTIADAIRHQKQYATPAEWGYTYANTPGWVVKTDSTCGDHGNKHLDGGGYEVVSPAQGGSDHLLNIGRVAKILTTLGAKVNNHCGLHCHVEIADFNDERAATLMAYWLMTENVIANMVPERRISEQGGSYCRLYTKTFNIIKSKEVYDPLEFWNLLKPRKLDPSGKRTAITFINYCRTKSQAYEWESFNRNTVELRLPEGTIDCYEVMNWARWFIHFVETSLLNKFPDKITNCNLERSMILFGLSPKSSDEFYVLSSGFYAVKKWICERILKYGRSLELQKEASRILSQMTHQEIPYHPPSLNEIAPSKVKKKKKKTLDEKVIETNKKVTFNFDHYSY